MRNRRLWPVISIVIGAIFAVEAVTHVPGVVFAVTGILAGAAYAIMGSYAGNGRRRN